MPTLAPLMKKFSPFLRNPKVHCQNLSLGPTLSLLYSVQNLTPYFTYISHTLVAQFGYITGMSPIQNSRANIMSLGTAMHTPADAELNPGDKS